MVRRMGDLEMKSIVQHVERLTDFTRVTCQVVRLIYAEGLKRCLEGFVLFRNCL